MRLKLATYSLATEHDVGGPKAVLFARLLGITRDHVDHLVTTGWELRYVGDRPRLVTAYIKGH